MGPAEVAFFCFCFCLPPLKFSFPSLEKKTKKATICDNYLAGNIKSATNSTENGVQDSDNTY